MLIYCKENGSINLNQVLKIDTQNSHRYYYIVFVFLIGETSWFFESKEERDKVYENILKINNGINVGKEET
jgi:hypothetical protein